MSILYVNQFVFILFFFGGGGEDLTNFYVETQKINVHTDLNSHRVCQYHFDFIMEQKKKKHVMGETLYY